MSRRSSLDDAHLGEETSERVRRSHRDALAELRRSPLASARVIEAVELSAGEERPVAHKMGRRVRVFISAPRGAATVEELREGSHDRRRFVVLKASADCTVDLLVVPE